MSQLQWNQKVYKVMDDCVTYEIVLLLKKTGLGSKSSGLKHSQLTGWLSHAQRSADISFSLDLSSHL